MKDHANKGTSLRANEVMKTKDVDVVEREATTSPLVTASPLVASLRAHIEKWYSTTMNGNMNAKIKNREDHLEKEFLGIVNG